MKICFTGIIIGVVVWGCGVRKTESRERNREVVKSEQYRVVQKEGERMFIIDTVRMVKAPAEVNRSLGRDSSRLETSLAWSVAVWKDGQLQHTMGNLAVVPAPVRTVYRDRWERRLDTVVIRDTVRERSMEFREVTETPCWWKKGWGWVVKITIIVMAGLIIRYKWKPK